MQKRLAVLKQKFSEKAARVQGQEQGRKKKAHSQEAQQKAKSGNDEQTEKSVEKLNAARRGLEVRWRR
ncbi:MAG: hypothetical protein ACI9OJ_003178 [Myxococcota bacterium]|jgi:hypothetical protein